MLHFYFEYQKKAIQTNSIQNLSKWLLCSTYMYKYRYTDTRSALLGNFQIFTRLLETMSIQNIVQIGYEWYLWGYILELLANSNVLQEIYCNLSFI